MYICTGLAEAKSKSLALNQWMAVVLQFPFWPRWCNGNGKLIVSHRNSISSSIQHWHHRRHWVACLKYWNIFVGHVYTSGYWLRTVIPHFVFFAFQFWISKANFSIFSPSIFIRFVFVSCLHFIGFLCADNPDSWWWWFPFPCSIADRGRRGTGGVAELLQRPFKYRIQL